MSEVFLYDAVRTPFGKYGGAVYTDHAVFLMQPDGVVVRDLFGISFSDLQDLVEVPIMDGTAS